jgi:hypothetical protein
VSAFLTGNVSILKLCLEEEASQAKGYIDVLQARITDTSTPSEGSAPFRKEIAALIGMQGEVVSAFGSSEMRVPSLRGSLHARL